jgi:hypothetical protein
MEEFKRLIRAGFGFILDEMRLRRVAELQNREILERVDKNVALLVKASGGHDARIQALREDHDALAGQVTVHERRIRNIVDKLPPSVTPAE